jgi:uncharacterized protein with PQ loop repeat
VIAVTFLGGACCVLTVIQSIPQAIQVRRFGAAGVSVGTWLSILAVSELWACYGIIFHVLAEIVANVPSAVAAGFVVALVSDAQGNRRTNAAWFLVLSGLVVGVSVLSVVSRHQDLVPALATAGAMFLYIPQFVKVLREGATSAISLSSWLLALVAAASWGVYGILIHKIPVFLPSVVLVPTALVIVVRVLAGRSSYGSEAEEPAGLASARSLVQPGASLSHT